MVPDESVPASLPDVPPLVESAMPPVSPLEPLVSQPSGPPPSPSSASGEPVLDAPPHGSDDSDDPNEPNEVPDGRDAPEVSDEEVPETVALRGVDVDPVASAESPMLGIEPVEVA